MNIVSKLALMLRQKRFYSKSQHWNRSEIEAYQDKKLIEIVRHAGINVPYYRELFKNIGLDPKTFRGREDIEKIPLLDKETLRTRYKEFIADNASHFGTIWHKTSGSTGTPLNMALDHYSVANKWAATARAYKWMGYNLGNKIFFIKGIDDTIKRAEYGRNYSDNSIFLNSNRLSNENCIKVNKMLCKAKPKFYSGYARSLVMFHQILKNQNIEVHKPLAILCFGETLTPQIRKQLEECYEAHVFDFYGHTENSVLICETDNHIKYLMEDYFYPELVDDKGVLTTQKSGELVGTSFYNYTMPLIRYRTRDIVRLSKQNIEDKCSFISIDDIEGRKDDCILTPDGRYLFIAEGPITHSKGIVAAQYVQEAVDCVAVNIIIDGDFEESNLNDITFGLKMRLGENMRIKYKIVDELEKKGSGKTPFIISRLNLNI